MYTSSLYFSLFSFLSSQSGDEQLYGRRFLLFSYGSGLASSMYSVVCRKVHESRFPLAQLQRSIQRARHRLDHERIQLTPELMNKLLFEREINEHTVPFIPSHPTSVLQSGDIYLKSIDKQHRRHYEKLVSNENAASNNDRTGDDEENVRQLYHNYFQKNRQANGDVVQ